MTGMFSLEAHIPERPNPWQRSIADAMRSVELRALSYAEADCSTAVWMALRLADPSFPNSLRQWVDVRIDLDPRYQHGELPRLSHLRATGGPTGLVEVGRGRIITLDEARFGDVLQTWMVEDGAYDPRLRRGHAAICLSHGSDPKWGRPCIWLWAAHPPGQAEVDGPGTDWYLADRCAKIGGGAYSRRWWCARPM
jgi:hypothetical protein